MHSKCAISCASSITAFGPSKLMLIELNALFSSMGQKCGSVLILQHFFRSSLISALRDSLSCSVPRHGTRSLPSSKHGIGKPELLPDLYQGLSVYADSSVAIICPSVLAISRSGAGNGRYSRWGDASDNPDARVRLPRNHRQAPAR